MKTDPAPTVTEADHRCAAEVMTCQSGCEGEIIARRVAAAVAEEKQRYAGAYFQWHQDMSDAREKLAEKKDLIQKLLNDENYVGGVRYWIAEHDKLTLTLAELVGAHKQEQAHADRLAEALEAFVDPSPTGDELTEDAETLLVTHRARVADRERKTT